MERSGRAEPGKLPGASQARRILNDRSGKAGPPGRAEPRPGPDLERLTAAPELRQVPSMNFGIFIEELRRGNDAPTWFQETFDLVDAAEAWGLDGVWLGE